MRHPLLTGILIHLVGFGDQIGEDRKEEMFLDQALNLVATP
ncbi:MAG: hypothetical protein ABGY41_20980 [Candidatus Poribacteria bacterium]